MSTPIDQLPPYIQDLLRQLRHHVTELKRRKLHPTQGYLLGQPYSERLQWAIDICVHKEAAQKCVEALEWEAIYQKPEIYKLLGMEEPSYE